MKVRTVSLTAAVAMAFMVLQAPAVFAQRNNGTFVGTPQPRAQSPYRTANPVQNTPILPMGNPIAPMGNPIAPIITPPFVRYSGGTPTVVIPNQSRGNRGNNYGHGGRDVVYVPVGGPYYYAPYYEDPAVLEPEPVIPGRLPTLTHNLQYPPISDSNANAPAAAPPAVTSATAEAQTEYHSEPRMIINEPRPDRVIVPPAIGTSRADVIARFGKPWGIISARGQETLYFDGLTVVFGADGRVIQTR